MSLAFFGTLIISKPFFTSRIVRVCVEEKNIGSRIITVMMKTTMLLATLMVVIVVIILHQIGICTAK